MERKGIAYCVVSVAVATMAACTDNISSQDNVEQKKNIVSFKIRNINDNRRDVIRTIDIDVLDSEGKVVGNVPNRPDFSLKGNQEPSW